MVPPMAEPSITIGNNNNWNNDYNTGSQAYRTSNNKVYDENPNNNNSKEFQVNPILYNHGFPNPSLN